MGLWVLEPKQKDIKVPGTVHIERDTAVLRSLTAHLKHGTGRDEDIVLVPQPSDSVNDPLNWPRSKKLFHSYFLALGTSFASGTCYFLNPSATLMSKQVHTSVTQISRTISVLMLCMGIASILTTPLARIYGKRPVFLGLGLVSVVGYGVLLAHPYDLRYLYAGRALWGAGVSGLEYLVSSSVGDLFFVHQRGFHLALWHFALAGGNSLGQVIASQIVAGQNYVWAFRYALIFMSAYIVAFFFLAPETTYNRPNKYDTDVLELLAGEDGASAESLHPVEKTTVQAEKTEKTEKTANESTVVAGSEPDDNESNSAATASRDHDRDLEGESARERPTPYLQSLRLVHGRFSDENYFVALVSPFATFMLPGVTWAAYSYGCAVAFSASQSVSLSSIFTVPPYNFSTRAVGLTVLAPFVANILGNFVPGPVADWLVRFMARKNDGVYEPEFRNILSLPALITGLGGYWGFGLCIHYQVHWFGPVFFFGLSAFSGSILSLVSNTYLLDCHRKHAQDGYAAVTLLKSVMTFAIAFFMNSWLARSGPIKVYFIIGTIHGVGCLYGLVLYVWGKQMRLAVHQNAFIQRCLP
ncbi:Major facilitator superfamily domain, general substrate transporter [Niveomyces insectorum RCEF 264]|uniref:Major facilitator superfamily domain, general substrate transporter n=1 Tax=Niveomyces insectorum RCEF 264 TaxID=1081102 RepID=A0A167ME19_9HYPO|nr:Major facilitator superfamily domain, general substrate transporter [Niveomyces insectorum RCEF 264]